MFRDCQSRNIMVTAGLPLTPSGGGGTAHAHPSPAGEVKQNATTSQSGAGAVDHSHTGATAGWERSSGGGHTVNFIDYQGGMKGAPQYDVASMLWQARANLPDEWKDSLLERYIDHFEAVVENGIDRDVFRSQYNGFVLIRLLQVLGAYGFRGLFERKAQFLTSIPQALKNLKWFVENNSLGIAVPEFKKVLQLCIADEVIERFTPIQADEETPLVVKICSFSYRKGIPEDSSVHGGGFVFDCRGIDNPGRHQEYKEIHGRDRPVMDYLERQTRIQDFLNSVFDIVDITVEEYIKRGFDHLAINFGCTGGQHRSVYSADAMAKHLRSKYKVKVELCHREQEAKGWKNGPLSPGGGT
ncbi:hypothetical protein HRG84_02865 [Flavisolibacter sp. BT320]|nr:hypothetical protein [Flavisolibacter longurius]